MALVPLLAAPLQGLLCQNLVSENLESNLPPDLTRGALLPVWGLQVNAVEDGLGAAGGAEGAEALEWPRYVSQKPPGRFGGSPSQNARPCHPLSVTKASCSRNAAGCGLGPIC